MSTQVSLCMICKNEEKTLFRCLCHVADFVDEMIVVDTGSTDRTVDHARRFTDRIFHFTWCDDFSAARNFALEKARHEWLLLLDADEVIYQEELEELGQLLRGADFAGVVLDQHQFEVDYTRLGYDDDIPWPRVEAPIDPKLRLVRNTGDVRYAGRIHESLSLARRGNSDIRPGIKFAHYRDRSRNQVKADYYMSLEELALVREPTNTNAHYNALYTYVLRRWRDEFNDAVGLLSYIEPRFFKKFDELCVILGSLGWHGESGRLGALLEANRRAEGPR